MAESDRARSYTLAIGAWRTFAHTSEPEEAFANRIADIGASQGFMAAAQAISDDCNAHGLQMSPQRVLKGYRPEAEGRQSPGPRPLPPGIEKLTQSGSGRGGCLGGVVLFVASLATWRLWSS